MAMDAANFEELRLDGMSRTFGTHNALKGINITIHRGEFIALLGPSGCGKSTALNCIAGLMPLTGGSIWLDDKRVDHLKPESRGFGMVFQNYALFPHMTVRRNVGFGLRMKGVSTDETQRRVEEALAVVRLQTQGAKLPGQLSGGQQQRVAIARAIAVSPPLVLMDEPLSNLDAKLRLEMRAEIRRIHRLLGSATIYVTHDQDEALSMADRIVVLRDGMVRQIGTPHELYRAPSHLDVAEFMGFRNAIPGKILGRDGEFAEVDCGLGSPLWGRCVGAFSDDHAIVAIRPTDLRVAAKPDSTGITATVTAIEYRGEAYFGTALGLGRQTLFFQTEDPVSPDSSVQLIADRAHVLIYNEGMSNG